MKRPTRIMILLGLTVWFLTSTLVRAETPEAELARYFAALLDTSASSPSLKEKRQLIEYFATKPDLAFEHFEHPLTTLRTDAAFVGMGKVAASTDVPSSVASDARQALGRIRDPRAVKQLVRIVEADLGESVRLDALALLATHIGPTPQRPKSEQDAELAALIAAAKASKTPESIARAKAAWEARMGAEGAEAPAAPGRSSFADQITGGSLAAQNARIEAQRREKAARSSVADQIAAGALAAADHLGQVAETAPEGPVKTAAARHVASIKKPEMPVSTVFMLFQSRSKLVSDTAREVLTQRKALDDRLSDADALCLAEMKEHRCRRLAAAAASEESHVASMRKDLVTNAKKLRESGPGIFAKKKETNYDLLNKKIQGSESYVRFLKSESNRIANLRPLDFGVQCFEELAELTKSTQKLRARAVEVAQGVRNAQAFANELPLTFTEQVTYRDNNGQLVSYEQESINAPNVAFAFIAPLLGSFLEANAKRDAEMVAQEAANLRQGLAKLSASGKSTVTTQFREKLANSAPPSATVGKNPDKTAPSTGKATPGNPAPAPAPSASRAKSEMALARLYLEAKNEGQAVKLFTGIVRTFPDSPEAVEARKELLKRGIELDAQGKQVAPAPDSGEKGG